MIPESVIGCMWPGIDVCVCVWGVGVGGEGRQYIFAIGFFQWSLYITRASNIFMKMELCFYYGNCVSIRIVTVSRFCLFVIYYYTLVCTVKLWTIAIRDCKPSLSLKIDPFVPVIFIFDVMWHKTWDFTTWKKCCDRWTVYWARQADKPN